MSGRPDLSSLVLDVGMSYLERIKRNNEHLKMYEPTYDRECVFQIVIGEIP